MSYLVASLMGGAEPGKRRVVVLRARLAGFTCRRLDVGIRFDAANIKRKFVCYAEEQTPYYPK
jgi:hypothetical protein